MLTITKNYQSAECQTFLEQNGIDSGRIQANGAGIHKPVADNATPKGRGKTVVLSLN